MSEWRPFPLHQPDPGMYIVAIRFHFSIIYDIGEWKDGEWVRLFEDDRVVAFMPFPRYEPEAENRASASQYSGLDDQTVTTPYLTKQKEDL